MKETLFSMYKKHFVVCAKERNNVLYAQETLCFLSKRKKHGSMYKKHFVVYVNERNTVFCTE